MSISNYAELKLLDTLRNVSLAVANTYIKLHTGDPGEDATANAATEDTRKVVTWDAAASGSIVTNSVAEWTAYLQLKRIRIGLCGMRPPLVTRCGLVLFLHLQPSLLVTLSKSPL